MKLIINTIFGLVILITVSTCYANNQFEVTMKCTDDFQFDCEIIKNVDGKKTIELKNVRSPQIKRLNNDFYHLSSTCGSPCQIHAFIGRKFEDDTNEFIAINHKNNCLIESDSKSLKIFSRKLLTNKKKLIMNMHDKKYEHVIYSDWNLYSAFQGRSYFDQDNNLHLIEITDDFDKNGNRVIFEKVVNNPCEK